MKRILENKEENKDLQKHGGLNIKDFSMDKSYLPIVDLEEKDIDLKSVKKFSDFGFNPSENLKFHLENKLSVLDNVFRPGSEAFYQLLSESRKFTNLLSDEDKELFETTDIGKFVMYEGGMVPLDLPMENIEVIYEAEYKGKEVDLNKPMRSSGPKKYKVYVKNPKTGKVKVVHFGDVKGGLSAKVSDPKARKAFSSRMDCPSKKDKTKAGYWSCRLNKFGHLFGGKTYPGYW
jgi:hypothetical protein